MLGGAALTETVEMNTGEMAYACIYCRTGGEEQLVRDLQMSRPEVTAMNPTKLRYRRVNGKPISEKVALFPGYIFLRLPGDYPTHRLKLSGLLYKLLRDSDNDWRLSGADRAFAEKLFDTDGVLGFSKAYYEGDRIRIVDGPLKALEGSIIRVNHRKRTAQVQLSIQGMDMSVWLGFELMEN